MTQLVKRKHTDQKLKLSVVIPAHNEEAVIIPTLTDVCTVLRKNSIPFEVIVVNDNSKDNTSKVVLNLAKKFSEIRLVNNSPPNGFGLAIRYGISKITGDCVVIVMADGSDEPGDIVKYYRKICEGYDCAFGSRFMRGAKAYDYPKHKLILNRITNLIIQFLFQMRYNDTTNAFKMYRRDVIFGTQPYLSNHFNLTVEIPLKAIIRGYSYAVVPTNWHNRKQGISKLKIKEMGSRYFFIILYCLLEKWLSAGDYKKSALNITHLKNK